LNEPFSLRLEEKLCYVGYLISEYFKHQDHIIFLYVCSAFLFFEAVFQFQKIVSNLGKDNSAIQLQQFYQWNMNLSFVMT